MNDTNININQLVDEVIPTNEDDNEVLAPALELHDIQCVKGEAIQNLDEAVYRNNPAISQSDLKLIMDAPALLEWSKNAPVINNDDNTDSVIDMGRAFHTLFLEPHEFSKRFVVSPRFDMRTTKGKADKELFLADLKAQKDQYGYEPTVINQDTKDKLDNMLASVLALPLGRNIYEAIGHNELSMFAIDEDTGLPVKIRIDKYIDDAFQPFIFDVKTIGDINRLDKVIIDYKYYIQDAFYSNVVKLVTGKMPRFLFLFVSTSLSCGKYPVRIIELDLDLKSIGYDTYKNTLDKYAQELKTGDALSSITKFKTPNWVLRKYEYEGEI